MRVKITSGGCLNLRGWALLLPFLIWGMLCTGSADAQPKGQCSIRHPQYCETSNSLFWSPNFKADIQQVVTKAKQITPSQNASCTLSFDDLIDGIGNISNGEERGDGYRIFYGYIVHAASYNGALAISDAGEVTAIGYIWPCDSENGIYGVKVYARTPVMQQKMLSWAKTEAQNEYDILRQRHLLRKYINTPIIDINLFEIQ